MIAFWVPALLVTLVALGFLLVPLFRRAPSQLARSDYDVTVYHDQLAELDRDLDRGVLNAGEADGARTEIKRRMLAASDDTDRGGTHTPSTMGSRAALAVIAVVVPIGAFVLYAGLGSPDLRDHPLSERPRQSAAVTDAGTQADARIEAMVGELVQRLEDEPDNLDGWILLGRSYSAMERYPDAAAALNRALQLSDRAPDLLSTYGEILILAQEGQVTPIAQNVFREALDKNPDDPRAQFYLGLARAQAGDMKGAYDDWVRMYLGSPEGAPWLPEIRARILAVAQELDIEDQVPAAIAAAIAPPLVQPQPGTPAPGPTSKQVEDATKMSDQDRDAMIRSMVDKLAKRLEENPDDRDGWLRLARAYEVLGDAEKAAKAQNRADALPGQ